MTMNCFSNAVILNIGESKSGKWTQWVKDVDTSQLEFLKAIDKHAEQTPAGVVTRAAPAK